jgi:four helix bundle protein
MDLVESIYKTTAAFPGEERFGLTSQMRRCSVSIPSNLAEGAARNTRKLFSNHVSIALGSAAELETQLEIAQRLNFTNSGELPLPQTREIIRLLIALRKSLDSE